MKKHKFAIILLIIGTLLVVMGLSLTIYNYMNNKNNENKETEANILNNYEVFKQNSEKFYDFRSKTYYNEVTINLFPESVETDYDNWLKMLDNYTSLIDEVESSSSNLKKYCLNNTYYPTDDIKNKCEAFVIAYETVVNYYTKDIESFNDNITSYLNTTTKATKVKLYESKYNYVDINSDGNFIGKN